MVRLIFLWSKFREIRVWGKVSAAKKSVTRISGKTLNTFLYRIIKTLPIVSRKNSIKDICRTLSYCGGAFFSCENGGL